MNAGWHCDCRHLFRSGDRCYCLLDVTLARTYDRIHSPQNVRSHRTSQQAIKCDRRLIIQKAVELLLFYIIAFIF